MDYYFHNLGVGKAFFLKQDKKLKVMEKINRFDCIKLFLIPHAPRAKQEVKD